MQCDQCGGIHREWVNIDDMFLIFPKLHKIYVVTERALMLDTGVPGFIADRIDAMGPQSGKAMKVVMYWAHQWGTCSCTCADGECENCASMLN